MKTYLILILIHFCIIASAQQIVPTSINSAGQSSTLNGNNISYSIGDYAVLTLADTNYTVSGSYIAASVITAIEISAVDQGKISVFPNPSSELVYVELSDLLANEILLITLFKNSFRNSCNWSSSNSLFSCSNAFQSLSVDFSSSLSNVVSTP